jgi:hypothetical protein
MSHSKPKSAQPSSSQTGEAFTVNQMSAKEEQKVGEDFMDKSIDYSPEALLASMKEFYENVLTNPQLKDLKMQLTTAMVLGAAATP